MVIARPKANQSDACEKDAPAGDGPREPAFGTQPEPPQTNAEERNVGKDIDGVGDSEKCTLIGKIMVPSRLRNRLKRKNDQDCARGKCQQQAVPPPVAKRGYESSHSAFASFTLGGPTRSISFGSCRPRSHMLHGQNSGCGPVAQFDKTVSNIEHFDVCVTAGSSHVWESPCFGLVRTVTV
jgi:hypothetical protein